jgi:hypothetical protein
MGFVTVKDFALALDVKGVTVRQRIVRKKLVKNEYGLIDVKDVTNFAYVLETNGGDLSVFEKYYKVPDSNTKVQNILNKPNKKQVFLKEKNIPVKKASVSTKKTNSSKKEEPSIDEGLFKNVPTVESDNEDSLAGALKESAEERRERKKLSEHRIALAELDYRQKMANAEYKEREAELKQIQLEKIAGNTLPLDVTKTILKVNLQAILIEFLSSVENMVALTVEELGGTRADNVRITKELKVMFKKTVQNSSDNANRDIEIAVAEYSETRSRGERK